MSLRLFAALALGITLTSSIGYAYIPPLGPTNPTIPLAPPPQNQGGLGEPEPNDPKGPIVAVPEPSTWVMAATGALVLGAIVIHQRKRQMNAIA